MTAILVADNEPFWLKNISELLEKKRYKVIRAINPSEAMSIIETQSADIAVLDLRLEDETSDYDISGFQVAQDSNRSVPKIIVSKYGSEQEFVQAYPNAMKIGTDARPIIVDFVGKGDIDSKLVPKIELALRIKETWSTSAQTKISKLLNEDYNTARNDARRHYLISLGISIGFALIIFWGAYKLHAAVTDSALPLVLLVIGVLAAEVTNYMFSHKLVFLYHRVERYHEELLQTERFAQLLGMSYSIKDEKAKEEFKVSLFNAAMAQWLCKTNRPSPFLIPTEVDSKADAGSSAIGSRPPSP